MCTSFFFNSMSCSSWSAMHGVYPNFKKVSCFDYSPVASVCQKKTLGAWFSKTISSLVVLINFMFQTKSHVEISFSFFAHLRLNSWNLRMWKNVTHLVWQVKLTCWSNFSSINISGHWFWNFLHNFNAV